MAGLNLPKKRAFEADAAFIKRVAAYLIDFLIIKLVVIDRFAGTIEPLAGSVSDMGAIQELLQSNTALIANLFLIEITISLLMLVYFVIFESRFGQTPGKMLLKLFIKSKEKKKELTMSQALIRCSFKVPASFFTLLMIADIIYYIFKRERLADMLAKTRVVEVVVE